MLKIKSIAVVGVVAMCAASLSSLAQEKPVPPTASPAAPKQDAKPAVPSIADGQALIAAEEFEEAAAIFHQIVAADPDNARAWHLMGFSLHAAGNLTDALPCHLMAAEFEQTAAVSSYNIACVYSLRGKPDRAFAWLERSREAGFDDVEQIEGDSDMDNIRKDPRYAAFVKSLQAGGAAGGGAGAGGAGSGEPQGLEAIKDPGAKPGTGSPK